MVKKIIVTVLLIFLIVLNGTEAVAWHMFQEKKNPQAVIETVWNFRNLQYTSFFGDVEYSAYCTKAMMCYVKVEGMERYDLETIRARLNAKQNYFKITFVMKGKNSTDLPYTRSYYMPVQYGRGADRYYYVISIMQVPSMQKMLPNIIDVRLKQVNLEREK